MTIKRFETGPRMSQAVLHNGTVYVAGQVAKGATVKDQTTAILKQIDSLLAAAGTDKTKLLSATIWLVNMGTFAEMNTVWDPWVSPGNTPARACVESKLATPEYLVEIAVICAV
ncbi:MAG: RidA family protein [Gammaproteobacteria bacterium]